jgi:hypothetical protein
MSITQLSLKRNEMKEKFNAFNQMFKTIKEGDVVRYDINMVNKDETN